jgi:hypothetical protein
MKNLDKTKSPAVKKALAQRRHRSPMLKLDDCKAFSSVQTILQCTLFLYRMKTAINRALKSEKSQKTNDCYDSQNIKVKKLNT